MRRALIVLTLVLATVVLTAQGPTPFGGSVVILPAGGTSATSLNLANNTYITATNAAGSGTVNIIRVNASDTIDFGAGVSGAAATFTGNISTTGTGGFISSQGMQLAAAGSLLWATRARLSSAADGHLAVANTADTIGARLKVDALPTIGSGFGTSPAVTAGSTPFAGSVNVGTGGTATTGVITWGGTAFPSTPFCTYSNTSTNGVTRGTPTTTQLTLNITAAWTASDIVSWICVSAK